MNFSFLTDEEALFFYPVSEVESLYLPVQSMDGARYIITERDGVDINENLTVERVDNDLHLKFYADSQTPSTVVLKDFALTNGKIFSLTDNGEYRQHVSAEHIPAQGPVALTSIYLGTRQEQAEAVSLKVIQHATILQTMENLAESLNPIGSVSPEPINVTTFADAMPQPTANLLEDSVAAVKPSITHIYDDVGDKRGAFVSGSVIDDKMPKIEGTGQPGAQLEVFQNGESIGFVDVDPTGNWSFTPSIPMQEGGHLFYVRDQATNQTSSNIVLIIDTVAPSRSEISSVVADNTGTADAISKNGATNDNTPTLNGKGEPNCLIAIYNGNEFIGATYASPSGIWSFKSPSILPDGLYEFRAVGIDFSGNTGLSSAKFNITIDTLAPDQPKIIEVTDNVGAITGSIPNGAATDDTTPTLKGLAEAGVAVEIYDNGNKLGVVTAGPDGRWEFTTTELEEGNHSLTVRAIDKVGNISETSQPWELVIDITPPDQPGISEILDGQGLIQGPIINGGTTDDTLPVLNGKGEPGSTIIITDNGDEMGSVTVGSDGNWTFTPEKVLEEGEHEIVVIAKDPAGNQSKPSEPWVVIIDTTAPDAPTIESIYDNAGSKTGELQPGAVTDDTTPTLKGLAEAGATVEIYDNGSKLGEVTAGPDGRWEFTTTEREEGEHSFTTRAIDAAGNASEMSQPWELVIDITPPDQPGISEILDDQGLIQGPIINGGTTDDTLPVLNGKGEPGSTIIITDNGDEIGSVTVGSDGNWTFTPEKVLEEGEHEIVVIAQDLAGNQSKPSEPWVVIVDTIPPDVPTIDSIEDDVGEKTGILEPGDVTDDTTPTLKGQAEAGATVEIYDNGRKYGEVTAGPDGKWEFTPVGLEEGEHSFTVRATDAAGNQSGSSEAWPITIIVQLPEAPVIESVMDDVGPVVGELISGSVTDDSLPVISGRSEPDVTVIIYDRGVEIGRAQADDQGRWSVTPEQSLLDGEYSFTAVVVNVAGNNSTPSDPFDLIVYTGNGPTQVARISEMGKDSGYDGNDFVTDNGNAGRLMHGTLSAGLVAGQTLQVSTDGGRTWFDALVEGTKWAAQDLSEHAANWTIQTRVIDQSGNSGHVMSQAVALDITAPRAPGAVRLEGNNLLVEFDPANVAVGERITVIADGGAQRFEHTLSAQDVAAGSVTLDVGAVSSASAALVDLAGNLSDFANTSGSAPSVNMGINGDVSEVYGQNRDNIFTLDDVNLLNNVKVIEGNGGIDTLKLTGADQVLDLSAWAGRLSSVEVIDITGTGNNTLKISLGDVLDQGFRGAFINDDSVQLAVKGNAGDVVMLSDLLPNGMDVGDWENLGEVVSAGISYDVYHHTGLEAEILVQQGVNVQYM